MNENVMDFVTLYMEVHLRIGLNELYNPSKVKPPMTSRLGAAAQFVMRNIWRRMQFKTYFSDHV